MSLWRFASRDQHYSSTVDFSRDRIGSKTPSAERSFRILDDTFEENPPFYVYCLRSPYRVLRSMAAMPWMKDDPIDACLGFFQESWDALLELQRRDAGRVRVVQLDKVGASIEERASFAGDVLGFLGENLDDGVRRFVEEWPVVDHWPLVPRGEGEPDPLDRLDASRLGEFGDHPLISEILRIHDYERP